ncbi:hypothetical protein IGI04_000744 [Brassica rapa subsp. trilocularis]|uniref:Saposin B-type domain-containing protein n=1 Tax=Brassica rapa subsp. trilocularis TaxID=1813537 RepID=A0ABQ7NQQ4_BRACM|nr:hypothetical protein IGI04_000744 [Brassica rapa subsp. trilocularis]
MVEMNRVLIAVTLALLASSALLPVSNAAKLSSAPRKEDVPYIKCQVCEKLASRLHQLVKEKQLQISPKKISEYEIIEIAENVCNLKKEEADWMLKIDIVEKGDKLQLVEQEEEGMCNSECKTIEAACQKVIGYSDTDVAEYIYKSKPDLASLVNHLCKDLTDACTKNPPPLPKDRVPGEPFVAKPSKDAEMDKIMRSMQGKVLKEKESSKKEEWRKTITKELKKKGDVLKRHAQKVSNRVRRWWTRVRSSSSKKPKSEKSEL